MVNPISTVISFSTLEIRFFDSLIKEVKKFSDDIIVVGYDHFFDGTKENISLINNLIKKYSELNWKILEWDSKQNSKYHHNNARWTGAYLSKHKQILFLDADEIPDGDLMFDFLDSILLDNDQSRYSYDLYTFSCYWYFRDPIFRATAKEVCGLLVKDITKLTKEMFFTPHERWFYQVYSFLRYKLFCTIKDNVIFNHYSWVRTKEEMLTKVKSWAHKADCNWTELVEKEFEHPFMGNDFVHGYSYTKVKNIFNIDMGVKMPESDPIVRAAAIELIRANALRLSKPILEIGVGNGYYGRTLKGIFPRAEIFGIEIWPGYLTSRHLEWYNAVLLSNALTFKYSLFKDNVSLIIAADVIEHFEKEDAIKLMEIWKKIAPWIVITLPIQDFEQGSYQGNVYETHRYQWKTEEVVKELGLQLIKDCGVCGLFHWAPWTW
jgi:hypothetical protein